MNSYSPNSSAWMGLEINSDWPNVMKCKELRNGNECPKQIRPFTMSLLECVSDYWKKLPRNPVRTLLWVSRSVRKRNPSWSLTSLVTRICETCEILMFPKSQPEFHQYFEPWNFKNLYHDPWWPTHCIWFFGVFRSLCSNWTSRLCSLSQTKPWIVYESV